MSIIKSNPWYLFKKLYNDKIYFRTISHLHTRIHEGIYFTANHTYEAVASEDNADFLIKSGDTPLHAIAAITSGGDAFASAYEDTEVSDNGTELDIICHNRYNKKTSDAQIFRNPTVTSAGTALLLNENLIGGQRRFRFTGAASYKREEWILNVDMNYLIRVTNKASSESNIGIIFSYYENGDLL